MILEGEHLWNDRFKFITYLKNYVVFECCQYIFEHFPIHLSIVVLLFLYCIKNNRFNSSCRPLKLFYCSQTSIKYLLVHFYLIHIWIGVILVFISCIINDVIIFTKSISSRNMIVIIECPGYLQLVFRNIWY